MSTKQLAHAAVAGRKVTFHFAAPTLEPITGYLCGMDDFHWMVVTPQGEQHLIHKSAARVDLHTTSSYDDESLREDLDRVVLPFRDFLVRTNVVRASSPSASTERAVSA